MQEVVLWFYKVSLNAQYFVRDVLTWQDAVLTVKVILFLSVSMVLSCILGDAAYLWVLTNAFLLLPLAAKKQKVQVDQIVALANAKIRDVVYKLPLIKSIEMKRKSSVTGESKKSQ